MNRELDKNTIRVLLNSQELDVLWRLVRNHSKEFLDSYDEFCNTKMRRDMKDFGVRNIPERLSEAEYKARLKMYKHLQKKLRNAMRKTPDYINYIEWKRSYRE